MSQIKVKQIIILGNLGGPNSLDEVEPFLFDLLSDPNVIRLPLFLKPLQKFLARLIVSKRKEFSQNLYRRIGGKSPLVKLTQLQAQALAELLQIPTFIWMSCGKPGLEELKTELASYHFERAIILPLYPQYSTTTSKTSLEQINCFFRQYFPTVKTTFIKSFPLASNFIAAWVERINLKLNQLSSTKKILLFSAHGIPQSYVDQGDPYQKQIEQSVKAIMEYFPQINYQICYQSRFGPAKWLEPSTDNIIKNLEPKTEAIIVPISFVSDHVETIHEIGIEFKEIAEEHGVQLHRVPGLNTSKLFIRSLADLIEQEL